MGRVDKLGQDQLKVGDQVFYVNNQRQGKQMATFL